jgi:hypothetical protein
MMGRNENLTHASGFFPSFDGKTWEGSPEGGWRQTYAGDGIVPHSDSVLTGAAVEILPPHRRCITTITRPRAMRLKIRVEGAGCVGAAVGWVVGARSAIVVSAIGKAVVETGVDTVVNGRVAVVSNPIDTDPLFVVTSPFWTKTVSSAGEAGF